MTRIEKLTGDHNLSSFDCGDIDLNEFLADDALPFQDKRIATTYVVIIDEQVAAYFSLLNDKISRTDVSKSAWRKLKKLFDHSKHRSNYPAIKIGRFAVSKDFASQGLVLRLWILSNNPLMVMLAIQLSVFLQLMLIYQQFHFI